MRGDIAVDTSVLVEALLATEHGRRFIDMVLAEEIAPYTTALNVTEALYILCRLLGPGEAERRVGMLLDSGYLMVVDPRRVGRSAAMCKCRFPVSMVDCHTLALARDYGMPALFYRVEREFRGILEELEKWVGGSLLFLADGGEL